METLQEMKVATANLDASFGYSTGVNVCMLTKSGTNAPHGLTNYSHGQQRWRAVD